MDFAAWRTASTTRDSKTTTQTQISEDELCDELSFLRKENKELVDLVDNCDHMLREAKKMRK
jgi:hypothetical protein